MKRFSKNDLNRLINVAKQSAKKSYSPYSKIKVGCVVLCKDGEIYYGSNIENMSYSLTICAERVAIAKAISEGKNKISAVIIYTDSNKIFTPCGACREFIKEFAETNKIPIICSTKKEVKTYDLNTLLPEPFNI